MRSEVGGLIIAVIVLVVIYCFISLCRKRRKARKDKLLIQRRLQADEVELGETKKDKKKMKKEEKEKKKQDKKTKKKKKKVEEKHVVNIKEEKEEEEEKLDIDIELGLEDILGCIDNNTNVLEVFSFETIMVSTNRFSIDNKLGEGGFGPVYKGILPGGGGKEVAVKRLSSKSGQGLVEFKNELTLIAKLQHVNLVQLLGYCIQDGERILVYEYMPNKSLDYFLFDSKMNEQLPWEKRLHIIDGIAQGLLYLHKYSRLRIIHRDLKVSNILLDGYMNPKISDFGMARIMELADDIALNTKRVVGTYGYMSPEYAMEGKFSVKSDVYSFGVILLEIVSGRRNNSFYFSDETLNLVGYAWTLWNKGDWLELVDSTFFKAKYCDGDALRRCIHVGLLCVEERASDRPTMTDVISMLRNNYGVLPTPKKAAFSTDSKPVEQVSDFGNSVNKITISIMEPR